MVEHTIAQQIEQVLEKIRPAIVADGGNIEFVSYENGLVLVKLTGACVRCPASSYTMKLGVEQAIKKELSFVQAVEAVDREE